MVSWDLRETHVQYTLPHPNVHVVFEANSSHAYGVVTGRFARSVQGKSHVFGMRFAPGMFRPFLGSALSQLTNLTKPVIEIFGDAVAPLERVLTSEAAEDELVGAADRFLIPRIPARDEKAELAKDLVALILENRDVLTVEHLCCRCRISKRTLERLFSEYVGVSPKWVIRRYRLQEAVEKLRSGESMDCAQLSVDLGYFDQAHLINDFKSIIGYTPAAFRGMHRL